MTTLQAVKLRIMQLCDERKITINKLATESAVSASTIKSVFYGNSANPGIVTIKKLCDGLDISLKEFFEAEYFEDLEQEIR